LDLKEATLPSFMNDLQALTSSIWWQMKRAPSPSLLGWTAAAPPDADATPAQRDAASSLTFSQLHVCVADLKAITSVMADALTSGDTLSLELRVGGQGMGSAAYGHSLVGAKDGLLTWSTSDFLLTFSSHPKMSALLTVTIFRTSIQLRYCCGGGTEGCGRSLIVVASAVG
jgi:hypothetical protein